jgi:hypothetical protein
MQRICVERFIGMNIGLQKLQIYSKAACYLAMAIYFRALESCIISVTANPTTP